MSIAEQVADVLLCATVLSALVLDVRTRRIPNAVTLPAVVAGIALQSGVSASVMLTRVGLVVFVTAVGYVIFALGIVGGGDVKLVSAIAALKGSSFLLDTLVAAALIGLGVATIVLARRRMLVPLVRWVGSSAWGMSRYGLAPAPVPDGGHKIPYAVVLTSAALVTLIGQYSGISLSRIW